MSQQNRRNFLQAVGMGLGALVAAQARAGVVEQTLSPRGLLNRLNTISLLDNGDGFYRLRSDGLPDHPTGSFPNAHCPFPILARSNVPEMVFKISKNPQVAAQPRAISGWLFGLAVNGVVFDPTGPYYKGDPATGWQFEVLAYGRQFLGIDFNNAHSQESGEYHYHGMPQSLILRLQNEQERARMILVGWAADGFPIYAPLAPRDPRNSASPLVEIRSSYQQKTGARPAGSPGGHHDTAVFVQDFEFRAGSGDLDECNGRFGVTPEFPQGIYHYFVTTQFPFIPRFWRGTPDPSFFHPQPGLAAVPKELLVSDYTKT